MFRKFVSITLLLSIIAMGISGLSMIILGSFKFQLQMHPVHKIFGVMMCISACFHIYFNFKSIKNYLKINRIAILGSVLFIVLILLFSVGMNKPLDQNIIAEIEEKMSKLEHKE